jgi:hypothetical protein
MKLLKVFPICGVAKQTFTRVHLHRPAGVMLLCIVVAVRGSTLCASFRKRVSVPIMTFRPKVMSSGLDLVCRGVEGTSVKRS